MGIFYDVVLEVLRQDDRFFTTEGELLRNAVYEAAMKMDPKLIKMLFENEDTKAHFFTDVDGIFVFDKVSFGWVINNREFLPDSYTCYKNKIGLVDGNGSYISTTNDVELVFPYKDCVLEGGQTKDDQKRSEIFYNKVLAPDEVDRLLYPKVFVNAKRYYFDCDYDLAEQRAGECTIKCETAMNFTDADNLIIRGNNLFALTSLLKRFEGLVKCIYIDPPYYFKSKKDEDTFAYNSNFKLSSWLAFMKNRLEMAWRLLSDSGALFVQINDDGVGELHCLLKEIFGADNFINKITVKTKSPSGFASVNPGVFETAEYILAFAKKKSAWRYNPQYVESGYDTNYKFVVMNKDDPASEWILKNIVDVLAEENDFNNAKSMCDSLGKLVVNEMIAQYAFEHAESVFRYTAIGDNAGQSVVEKRDKSRLLPDKIFAVEREEKYTVYIHKGQEIAFYSKKMHKVDGKLVPSIQVSNIWTDTPYEGIASEGGVTLKGGKKPEKLICRILEMASNRGDIVLDYHLGSGTTCAVAHKIGRRYIGVEQLEYGDDDATVRLKSVIKGDPTGVSSAVNWKGGGSFVYCELARLNQQFVDRIEEATSDCELAEIWSEMQATGFISSKVNPKDVDPEADDFKALSLQDKKRLLMELLDMNQLYINYCDIDDETFGISEADKAFTKSFYGEG